jgi:hypothetical protein
LRQRLAFKTPISNNPEFPGTKIEKKSEEKQKVFAGDSDQ